MHYNVKIISAAVIISVDPQQNSDKESIETI